MIFHIQGWWVRSGKASTDMGNFSYAKVGPGGLDGERWIYTLSLTLHPWISRCTHI